VRFFGSEIEEEESRLLLRWRRSTLALPIGFDFVLGERKGGEGEREREIETRTGSNFQFISFRNYILVARFGRLITWLGGLGE